MAGSSYAAVVDAGVVVAACADEDGDEDVACPLQLRDFAMRIQGPCHG